MAWKEPIVGMVELIITLLLLLFIILSRYYRRRQVSQALANMVDELCQAGKSTLLDSPFPMVVFRPESGEVVWSNDRFLDVIGRKEHMADARINMAIPSFDMKWLLDGEQACPVEYTVHGKRYMVFGHIHQGEEGKSISLATTYWLDITALANTREQYYATRPLVCIITIDNYEELTRNLLDSDRSSIRAGVEECLDNWVEGTNGMLCRYDRDRYLYIVEEQYLEEMKKSKFAILDAVHHVTSPNGIPASLSIGIGRDGSYLEMFRYAGLAVEMALSRGGDQVVIKNQYNFEFYGGRSREQERRTKVKSRVMANALGKLIKSSSNVLVMGHRYGDFDAAGAAIGVCAIARTLGVDVHIVKEEKVVPCTAVVERMEQYPAYEHTFIFEEDALQRIDENTLLVVVDTNRPDQVAYPRILERCHQIAVIDHHRRAADYISNAVMNYHEPYASSASELVAELIQYTIEASDLNRVEAEALLAGIVLDTKNFTLRTGGRTFEAAAFLRRCGADTSDVRSLFQNDLDDTIKKVEVLKNTKFVHEGIAVAVSDQTVGRIIASQAADELLNVSGVAASFVLYTEDDGVNISGRSSGDVNVQVILEELGGGGNANAAGVQMKNIAMWEAVHRLKKSVDRYFNDSGNDIG